MSGMDELNRELKPKCPHCNASLDLRDYWKAMFSIILERLAAGERIRITNFGSFEAKAFGGWKIKGLDGKEKEVRIGRVIRFYASEKAKKLINLGR